MTRLVDRLGMIVEHPPDYSKRIYYEKDLPNLRMT